MIPKSARRVFKGIIFDVYQWKQKMFDGSYQTFEALKRTDSIRIIATNGNKILIAEESQPTYGKFYGLFGGRREKGESPLTSAKRELLEETGFVSGNWKLLKIYKSPWKISFNVYFFAARDCKKIKEPTLDSGEKINVREISFEHFLSFVKKGKIRESMITEDLLKIILNKSEMRKFRKILLGD